MANYSNTTRITGLSGIDTESLVNQLMKAESLKLQKLQKNNTTLTWKQEAYWSAADSLKSFQSSFLSLTGSASVRLKSSFANFNTSVKVNGVASNAVKVSTSSGAVAGSYKIKVSQLAQKDTYKSEGTFGASIQGKEKFDDASLAELKKSENGINFRLNLDGVGKTISFTKDELEGFNNVDDYVNALNLKLKDNFGKNNGTDIAKIQAKITAGGKLDINATASGHTLTISEGSAMDMGTVTNAKTEFDWAKMVEEGDGIYTLKVNGKDVKVDLTSLREKNEDGETVAKKDLKGDEVVKLINSALSRNGITASFTLESEKDDEGNITSQSISLKSTSVTRNDIEFDDNDSGLMAALGFNTNETLEATSALSYMSITNGDSNHYGSDDKLGDVLSSLFGKDANDEPISEYTFKMNGVSITLNKDDSMDDLMTKFNNAGVGATLSYDKLSQTYTLQAKNDGAVNSIGLGEGAEEFLSAMKLTQIETGKDAVVSINGVETTRASNTFTFEGITLTLNDIPTVKVKNGENEEVDEIQEIVIDIEKDYETTKNTLKNFVDAYNALIGGLNGMVDEKRAKTAGSYYEPLTDEEKAAMSDSEIEKWESQAKTGLLNRDSILSGITSAMRTQLYQSVTLSDGTKLSLHQIGITTSSNYSDQGKLVIDEDKLMAALDKYGDKITDLFTQSADKNAATNAEKLASTGLGDRLNNIIQGAIDGVKGSIAEKAGIKGSYTENDNQLLKEINRQNQRITEMLAYLANREDYYYQMFSKVESAVSSNDSQLSYLQQMFGL